MKRLTSILIIFITVFLSSCSVYENIYFLENGDVKYDMSIDAGEMIAAMSNMEIKTPGNLPTDSIIHLADLIKDSLEVSTNEIQDAIKNIEPIYLKYENNAAEGKFGISIYGDFDNADALNKAFASMAQLEQYMSKNKVEGAVNNNFSLDNLYNESRLVWDGTTMKRIITPKPKEESEDEGEGEEKTSPETGLGSFSKFFANGKMVVKYYFPKKITNVSNPDATLTLDGKTAIIQYPASMLAEPSDKFSIEITTEK